MSKPVYNSTFISQKRQELLKSRLKQKGIDLLKEQAITPRNKNEHCPLSMSQHSLWLFHQLEPDDIAYLIPIALRLQGRLNVRVFEQCWSVLVQRHESLRTMIQVREGEPVQIIQEVGRFRLLHLDLRGLPKQEREREVQWLADQEAHYPCDLVRGPLLRVALLHLDSEEHVLLVTMHHIISDGWSNEVLVRELGVLYHAFVAGAADPLPPLPIQYADFAVWQRQWLQGEVLAEHLRYWEQQLAQAPRLELPTDYPRPRVQTFRGAFQSLLLAGSLYKRIKALSQQENVTVFMLLLASLQVVLARYSGQVDISIGTPIANRTRSELEGLVGYFVNTLVLRTDLSGNPTFVELLGRVREVALSAYAHQDVPFEYLVEKLHPQRDPGYPPFFQIMFGLQQSLDMQEQIDGLRLGKLQVERTTTKFDLAFKALTSARGLSCGVDYNTDLFETQTIERMLTHWQTVLEGIVAHPQTRLSDLPLLPDAERCALLVDANTTERAIDHDLYLHGFVEAQAVRIPDAVAVTSPQVCLSYGDLNGRANRLAHHLRSLGVSPEVRVGVSIERSVEGLICLLAVLKAGGVYVPLDPAYPVARLAYLLHDSQASVVLTKRSLLGRLPDHGAMIVCLDEVWEVLPGEPEEPPLSMIQPDTLAYVIYTSGSTGHPKGVAVSHRGIGNLAAAQVEGFQVRSDSRVLQFASLSFDASISEIGLSLLAGATLCVVEQETLLVGTALLHALREQGITHVTLPPSVLTTLPDEGIPTLQTLIVAGEACPAELVRWGRGRLMVNAYGPTETTVCATMARCSEETQQPAIGRPIANTQVYVLDEQLAPVPTGVPGELYIGGIGVARGYLYRPDLTAERFIPNPYCLNGGERLYKTGDRVRYRSDGTLDFLGRLDQQIKLRGYRIESGEIETVIREHPQIRDASVLVYEDASSERFLTAYVVYHVELTDNELRQFLQERVPNYMIPSTFVKLDQLPLMPSGKVDQKALQSLSRHENRLNSAVSGPRTSIEELLQEIWCQVLGDKYVGIHESFFDLGGHSLLGAQVVARIQSALHVEIPLRYLFETPTIAGLAQRVEQALHSERNSETPPLVPVSRSEPLPLSFAQQRLWFLEQLEPNSSVYVVPTAFRIQGELSSRALERSLHELLRRHEILRTTFTMQQGQPVQIIHPPRQQRLPVVDLQGLEQQEREEQIHLLVQSEGHRPFDLSHGSLLRTWLLRLQEQEHALLLTMHHIITDGWSNGIFSREVTSLYRAFVDGEPSTLAPLPIQYADFASWQRQWVQGKVLEEQLSYWKQHLAGAPTLELPTDVRRPAVRGFAGACQTMELPGHLAQALKLLSRQEEVTLFMVLLAAFEVLLMRYSGQEDLSVGTVVANRSRAELEGLIGFFVNTLVLRVDLSGNPTFEEVVKRVRTVTLEAYAHQDVPFEQVVEQVQPERDLSRSPLFQVMFGVVQTGRQEETKLEGLWLSELPGEHSTTKFDLTVTVVSAEEGMRCGVEYSTELFAAETIERLLQHWRILLENIVAAPHTPLADLPLLTERERSALLVDWNLTQTALPTNHFFHTLFEEQVACTPDTVAVVSEETSLTYQELNRRANRLARYLQGQGVVPEVRVGVYAERSSLMVIELLAVFKAGGVYIPLDPSYPSVRSGSILADADVSLLVIPHVSSLPQLPPGLRVICLQDCWPRIMQQSEENITSDLVGENLAYMIYTSGSSGRPKGVQITHQGLCNLALAQARAFDVQAKSHMLQFVSLSFDVSIAEMTTALLAGSSLYLASAEQLLPGPGLITLLDCLAITIVMMPASSLAALPVHPVPLLETLVVGGEACSPELVERWSPGRRFYNAYGPTETTVCASIAECVVDRTQRQMPSIGTPIANMQVYILDKHLQLVPWGVPGELYIGGVGLARGYQDLPETTAVSFIPHPWSRSGGERLYKTGDRVRFRADGMLDFLGRLDQQVKMRGYRIEPGEIESVLAEHAAVRECVVVLSQETSERQQLVAYIVAWQSGQEVASDQLQAYLQERLPYYMVPSRIVQVDAFPLNANGKVDRQALSMPQKPHSEEDVRLPRTPVEVLLGEIWCEVLDYETADIFANFFDLGGHSLVATQLLARVRAELQVEISVAKFFESPTIAELAKLVEQEKTMLLEQIEHAELEQALASLEELSEDEVKSLLTSDTHLRSRVQ